MKNLKHIITILLIVFLFSCNEKTNDETEQGRIPAERVILTEVQSRAATIQTGPLERKVFQNPVVATGMLDVPPQNVIDVSAPLGGFVKHTALLQGMRVKKGDVLVELQHADYIQMQQDYLQTVSQLEFLEADYTRQTALAKENINAQKAVEQARANVQSMRATALGLRAKLALLNIKADQLETNGIQSTVRLYAPIAGYVTEVNVNLGKYVSSADIMFRIVDTHHLHAELQVFEKDITRVKEGQKVRFRLSSESMERNAKVYLIGREINAERTVRVHCHLETEDPQLLPGMFIRGIIETSEQPVYVLPGEAVVSHQGKRYAFIQTENRNEYRIVQVKIGAQQDGYTSIEPDDTVPEDAKFVLKGAYTLLSLMYNMEEDE